MGGLKLKRVAFAPSGRRIQADLIAPAIPKAA
jgi:hypothetical protein